MNTIFVISFAIVNIIIFLRIAFLFEQKITSEGFKLSSYQEPRGGWLTCEIETKVRSSLNNALYLGIIINFILVICYGAISSYLK